MRFRCNNRVCETIRWALAIAAIGLASPLHTQTIQVKSNQKIADNTGGFGVTLTNSDEFGIDVDNLGDLDNDGVKTSPRGQGRTTQEVPIAVRCTCCS